MLQRLASRQKACQSRREARRERDRPAAVGGGSKPCDVEWFGGLSAKARAWGHI